MAPTRTTPAKPASGRGERKLHADRYVVVLVLLGAVILASAFATQDTAGRYVVLLLLALTLIITLVTSEANRLMAGIAGIAVTVAIAAGLATEAVTHIGNTRLGYQLAVMAMGVIIAVVIARRIVKHPTVSVDTVAGAAAIYLLFGLIFAVLFAFVGDLSIVFDPSVAARLGAHPNAAQAFFIGSRPPVPSDFMYFSYVTLTTVGYGDLTAATGFGRMLAVCEALFGQLYLVTVVAILVSNLRPRAKAATE